MSETINNREYRKNVIKKVITKLHEGKSVEEVKQEFEEAFSGVSASEISQAEAALIAEGLPVGEVQRLCDVHAAVFKGSIEEIHQPVDQTEIPGHPANTLKRENREIERIINKFIRPYLTDQIDTNKKSFLLDGLQCLTKIDIHYLRKENLFFPYLEKYGITAPPKVMWGVDDEIRNQLDQVNEKAKKEEYTLGFVSDVNSLTDKITEMIFKEENILLPMLLENLTVDEWKRIADESADLGFMIATVPVWKPQIENKSEIHKDYDKVKKDTINLSSGILDVKELEALLNTLPFDITFVDVEDTVKYFSLGKERIFPRTKAIIGRNVSNCHPPASVHIVEKIVEDFKNGVKDHEDFWINMGDRLVYIRYYAVRDDKGNYLGTLEVTQDIKPIQEIAGEKRLMS